MGRRIRRDLGRRHHREGNAPAWWHLALLAAGTGPLAVAATRRWPRPALIFGAARLALAGVLPIGMLLVPAAVAAAVAAAGTFPRPRASEPAR
jgi:hypothetical protein